MVGSDALKAKRKDISEAWVLADGFLVNLMQSQPLAASQLNGFLKTKVRIGVNVG